MHLYFTNCSKQKKVLIDSEYVEDIYDEILTFFEEYHIFPHFISIQKEDEECKVYFNPNSEYFGITDIKEDEIKELQKLFAE